MKTPKNLTLIRKKILLTTAPICLIFIIASFILQKFTLIYSALLGYTFGIFLFNSLINTQAIILATKNKRLIVIRYFLRLISYAIPLSIGLYYKAYFNIIVILVFLFLNQLSIIIFELFRSLSSVKKKGLIK